jgi:hypothetical protein
MIYRRWERPGKILGLLLAASCLSLGGIGTSDRSNAMSSVSSDPVFDSFRGSLFEMAECSPEIDKGFFGLKLAGPATVRVDDFSAGGDAEPFARVLICGVFRVKGTEVSEFGRPQENIVLYAVDEANGKILSGTMSTGAHPVEVSALPTASDSADTVDRSAGSIRGYFNPNLVEYLDLPPRKAEYTVYASYGPYKSNAVRIRLAGTEDQ